MIHIPLSRLPAFSCRGNGHEEHEECIALEIAILRELHAQESKTLDIAVRTQSGYKSALYHLKALMRAGFVTHNGKIKGRVWRLA